MKKHQVASGILFLLLLLAVNTPQFAQDTSAVPSKAEQERHRIAIGLLRTINTSEVTYRSKNGSFATWKSLLAAQPKSFDGYLANLTKSGAQKPAEQFSDAPAILPGWNLRLNVHADGQGYDVLLRDTTDEKCDYAALTDESGVIRQSKAIDCDI
jgi:hypothetical protein